MNEQAQQMGFVEFASKITDIAFENDVDFSTIFNGLAVASGAFLVDFASDENNEVDADRLANAIVDFTDTVERAVDFALKQIEEDNIDK